MDEATFAKGMAILTECYKQRFSEMDEGAMEIWFRILEPLTDAEFENAVIFYCRENPHRPPDPAAIIDTARFLDRAYLTAEEVLQKVIQLAKRGTQIPELRTEFKQDPAALKAIDTLGWDRIRFAHTSEWPFIERRFLESYKEHLAAQELGISTDFLPHNRYEMIAGRIPGIKRIGQTPEGPAAGPRSHIKNENTGGGKGEKNAPTDRRT